MTRRTRGFTLIEILVAVAIFGLLSVGAYSVLDAGMRSKIQTQKRLDQLEVLQRVIYSIEKDIQMLSLRPVRNELGDQLPIFRAQSDFSGQSGFMELTRANWRNPLQLPRSNLQHIIYNFDQGKLVRHHSIFLDTTTNSPSVERVLIENVDSFKMEFLNKGNQWSSQWANFGFSTEDDKKKNNVPKAIKISLEVEPFGLIERLLLVELALAEVDDKENQVLP